MTRCWRWRVSPAVHELAVCQALMQQVEGIARDKGAHRVTAVTVRIGPLSGVEPELLEQAFPLAAAGSVAETAGLVIETLPIRVRCDTCGAETEVSPNRLVCGDCGDWHTHVTSGDEMLLASLQLITDEDTAHV